MSSTTTAGISDALAELEADFGPLTHEPDGEGGVYVTIHNIEIGSRWSPASVPLSFRLLYNFPFSAVYPFYAPPELTRAGSSQTPSALQRVDWREQPVTQVSLRFPNWQPQHDTASSAVAALRHWFQTTE